MDDLVVDRSVTIPAAELEETFSTSGGPGGQHANRAASRVTLAWDLTQSSLDDGVLARIRAGLGAGSDRVTVTVDESRSQWRNRKLARRRLADVVAEALRPPAPPRRPTRPSRSQRRARLADKRHRGQTKKLRRRPSADD